MSHYLVSGGSGMVGTAVTKKLIALGHSVTILGRSKPSPGAALPGMRYAVWDPAQHAIEQNVLDGVDTIIHLAGANVAERRWTAARKKEIVASRVDSGNTLVKALRTQTHNVKTFISASAIGWYGPDPQVPNPDPYREDHPPYNDYLGLTCRQWEAATEAVSGMGIRRVVCRIGIVLSREGGAYAAFRKPASFGIATIIGSGRQVISWIHVSDLVEWIIFASGNASVQGVYNVVATSPVNNAEMVRTMASVMEGKQLVLNAPALAIKLALGEMSIEVLKSTTVSNKRLLSTGFALKYPDIYSAIRQLEEA